MNVKMLNKLFRGTFWGIPKYALYFLGIILPITIIDRIFETIVISEITYLWISIIAFTLFFISFIWNIIWRKFDN